LGVRAGVGGGVTGPGVGALVGLGVGRVVGAGVTGAGVGGIVGLGVRATVGLGIGRGVGATVGLGVRAGVGGGVMRKGASRFTAIVMVGPTLPNSIVMPLDSSKPKPYAFVFGRLEDMAGLTRSVPKGPVLLTTDEPSHVPEHPSVQCPLLDITPET
jgi:hypothetical protein